MAKQADIEKPISMMRPANAKAVQKILDRASKAAAAESRAAVRDAGKISSGVGRGSKQIARTLGLALAFHGRATKGSASMKQKAPDTGGRTFHFSHSTVSRNGGKRKAASASGGGGGGSTPGRGEGTTASGAADGGGSTGGGSSGGKKNRETAHQAYVERDSAVAQERGASVAGPLPGKDAGAGRGEPARERELDDGGLEPGKGRPEKKGAREVEVDQERAMEAVAGMAPSAHASSARAAQAYVEDEAKLDRRFGHASSFGTIGETYEERLAFWDLVHEHEREKDARTQTRLVLELPHEADAETRQRIVKRYCAWFEENGVPYWAAIHQPTKSNDDRNYHAHVVFMDRPAKRMIHPESGEVAWDFTVQVKRRDKTRHTKVTYPHRRKKTEEMRHHGFVKDSRARFAAVANEVLEKAGSKVRYDARSYKDMGLDVEPMADVSRVFADKMKSHDFVAMDAEWTRRMIKQEMEVAAAARDKTFLRLRKVETQLREATKDIRRPLRANRNLPPNLRVGVDSKLTERLAEAIVTDILRNERDRIAEQFVRETTRKAIAHVVAATAPTSAKRNGAARKAYAKAGETPDPAAMAALHAAAMQELQEFDHATRSWRLRVAEAAQRAYGLWNRSANPSRYQPRPAPAAPQASEPPKTTIPGMPPMPAPPGAAATAPGKAMGLAATAPAVPVAPQAAETTRPPFAPGLPKMPAMAGLPRMPGIPAMAPAPATQPQEESPPAKPRTHEEFLDAVYGPPNSMAQRMRRLMDAAIQRMADLKERGLIDAINEHTMKAFMESFREGYLRDAAKAASAANPAAEATTPAAEASPAVPRPVPGTAASQEASPPSPVSSQAPQPSTAPHGPAPASEPEPAAGPAGAPPRRVPSPAPAEPSTTQPATASGSLAGQEAPRTGRPPSARPPLPRSAYLEAAMARRKEAEANGPTPPPHKARPADPVEPASQPGQPRPQAGPPEAPAQRELPILDGSAPQQPGQVMAPPNRPPVYRNPKLRPEERGTPAIDPALTGLFDDADGRPNRPIPVEAKSTPAESLDSKGVAPAKADKTDKESETREQRKKRLRRRAIMTAPKGRGR